MLGLDRYYYNIIVAIIEINDNNILLLVYDMQIVLL